jgi:hypothetical protein
MALCVVVALEAGSASARARVETCEFKRGGVVVALAGSGVRSTWGSGFCAGLHATFGRRYHGRFGTIQCDFWNRRHRALLAVVTRRRSLGWRACWSITPAAIRAGFREVDYPLP